MIEPWLAYVAARALSYGCAMALFGAAVIAPHQRTSVASAMLLSAALLATLALVGHAAAKSGAIGQLNRASQITHLLSAAFWIGALAPLLATLHVMRDPELRASSVMAFSRFSAAAGVAVALVLLTGALNTRLALGAWPIDFTTPYRLLLFVKFALVGVMLALAAVNRFWLTPRAIACNVAALAQLKLTILADIALAVAILGLVAAFGTLEP